ncbi:hypothetical protein NUW54_g2473 [Trametes sanguinea]|uniref:Uncharacterized protein n=1 Tax=Trametes sanguinea TaxID=158606 RepID=A0ACC1Q5C7_9APHY|nr:hypothetical protein NUW54_g2473 [Trametes sanguinea]
MSAIVDDTPAKALQFVSPFKKVQSNTHLNIDSHVRIFMAKVQLYVYDLSNGLAKTLSRQLTGRQIDGIWHTSVVVFGKEIFYGQGICITQPGMSHHGKPLHIIDMGETSIDEETFDEYLAEMREHYTADKTLTATRSRTIALASSLEARYLHGLKTFLPTSSPHPSALLSVQL